MFRCFDVPMFGGIEVSTFRCHPEQSFFWLALFPEKVLKNPEGNLSTQLKPFAISFSGVLVVACVTKLVAEQEALSRVRNLLCTGPVKSGLPPRCIRLFFAAAPVCERAIYIKKTRTELLALALFPEKVLRESRR